MKRWRSLTRQTKDSAAKKKDGAMSKVTATIEVEFETRSEAQAGPALMRMPGDLAVAIEFGSMRSSAMTGVVQGSVKIEVTQKTIDGRPVS
jgi:hypothetical protein